ncbi:HNH endonuclease [Streptomyces sp. NPDC052077]|uniref:HNH endonuclease n=1 Tax=Streptomyces sp. NPDC052077 TaxID=3154757 RepID=UPI0034230F49
MRIPAWTEDELVLAGALVVENGWKELRTGAREVHELSGLLRALPLHSPEALALPGFRSPDSVSRKTTDFMTNHPDYPGKATRCGKPTLLMIRAFLRREAEMVQAARVLRDTMDSGEMQLLPRQPDEVDETGAAAVEGRLLVRRALIRERDPKLRLRKIRQLQKSGRPLSCEVCAFDFFRAYGDLGRDYIEVHHITPLHVSGTTETRLEDLACLCANCHRMCHRNRPGESWRTPESLRTLMRVPATRPQ